MELISKTRDRAIVNGVRWLANSNIGLTIEVNTKMPKYGGEEHAIGEDTVGRGKDIHHMLDDEEA